MRTDDFDYELPERCIAQAPAPVRDACKMLAMDRKTGQLETDFPRYLRLPRAGRCFGGQQHTHHAGQALGCEARHPRRCRGFFAARAFRRRAEDLIRRLGGYSYVQASV